MDDRGIEEIELTGPYNQMWKNQEEGVSIKDDSQALSLVIWENLVQLTERGA